MAATLYSGFSKNLIADWDLDDDVTPKILSPIHPVHDIEDVRYHLIDKALLHLYKDIPVSGKVCIFTYLLKDGKGDQNTQTTAFKLLKDAGYEVTCFSLDENTKEKDKSYPEIPKEFLSKLETYDLVLEIPTKHPDLETKINQMHTPPAYEAIGEYGYFESTTFNPKTPYRSMGLNALEKGVFLKEMPLPFSNAKKVYPSKRDWLKSFPEEHILHSLNPHNRLNIDYTKSTKGHTIYLNLLLELLKDSQDDIDVLFFYPFGVLYGYQEGLLKKESLKELKITFKGETSVFQIAESGKTLHLIHSPKLKQEDFLSLLSSTDDLIGCTGDGSFTEAISTKKMFYYDALPHKERFQEDLLQIAKHYAPNCMQVLEGKKIKKEWKEDFNTFASIFPDCYNFNPILLQIVKRALLLKKYPSLHKSENQLVQEFKKGVLPAKSLLLKVKLLLDNHLNKQADKQARNKQINN